MTYGDIYKEFIAKFNCESIVSDWRPCCELFDVPNIDNAIVVWLKSGGKVVYICENPN